MCELSNSSESNSFINGDTFPVSKVGNEPVPSGGTGNAFSEFIHSDGKAYDIQYVQVGWSLSQTLSVGGGYTAIAGSMHALGAWRTFVTLMGDSKYFNPTNIIPNNRGFQLGVVGALMNSSFNTFTGGMCSCGK